MIPAINCYDEIYLLLKDKTMSQIVLIYTCEQQYHCIRMQILRISLELLGTIQIFFHLCHRKHYKMTISKISPSQKYCHNLHLLTSFQGHDTINFALKTIIPK